MKSTLKKSKHNAAFIQMSANRDVAFNAMIQQALALHQAGQFPEAKWLYQNVLNANPKHFDALQLMGVLESQAGNHGEALVFFDRALAIKRAVPALLNNRGLVLNALGRFEEALESYLRAIRLQPDFAEAFNNRGITQYDLKRFDEAIESYSEAIRLQPKYLDALYNRGNALQEVRRFDDALQDYFEANRLKPDFAEANWNLSLLLLLLGHFDQGWTLYEWRLSKSNSKSNYLFDPGRSWRGVGDIKGKRILVYGEQGFGDALQFIRYLPMVKAMGADIVCSVARPLHSIVATMQIPMTIVDKDAPLPSYDLQCPLMSLPLAFNTTIQTIPTSVPYLFPDKTKIVRWAGKLGSKTLKRVGLAWSGSSTHKNDTNRSTALAEFGTLLDLPFEWHSLQKEYRPADLEMLGNFSQIQQHQSDLHDFGDTAALIECMDLIISVDTSVVHLAGAINKKVWILLPFLPDYRWMLDRDDSPWYPSARLFRQDSSRKWSPTLALVRDALLDFLTQ